MLDLISRQQAIEVLRNRWLKTRNYEGIGEDIAEECEIYLKTLPSVQPETNCSEIPNNSDTISRQAAIEPEAISKWKKEFREYVDSLDITRDDWKGIIEYIDELPSAQPEIIRCKDCKFYTAYDYTGKLMCKRIGKGMILPKPEDYCSYAERITDGRPD